MIRSLGLSLLDLWLPPACVCCRRSLPPGSGRPLCVGCLSAVEFMQSPLCIRCGAALSSDGGSEDRLCADCITQMPLYDRARSVVHYREPLASLLIKLKFHADTRVAAPIGWLATRAPIEYSNHPYDLIVPVPLHRKRLQKRGLNQSLILARLMFAKYGIAIAPTALIRVRNSVPQTLLTGWKRRINLKGAFEINPHTDVSGKSVCVVDDVFTTGTTVSECAKTLKSAGAQRVDVCTFARA